MRQANFIKDGDKTPYGVTLDRCHINRCWNTLITTCQYYERKKLIENFNRYISIPIKNIKQCFYRSNECVKRGICVIPTKYGIAFGLKVLNQGGALVHVYKDGSILLTHGGVEIGQVRQAYTYL